MIRAHPLDSDIGNLLRHKLNDGSDDGLKDLVNHVATMSSVSILARI